MFYSTKKQLILVKYSFNNKVAALSYVSLCQSLPAAIKFSTKFLMIALNASVVPKFNFKK